MKKFLRGLDWQTLAVLTALILVVGVVWRLDDAGRQIDAASRQRDVLIAALDGQSAQAARDRAAAARDRAALLDYTKAIAAQQAAENQWLINHHFPVPQRFLTVIRPPRIVVRHPRATHHTRRRHRAATSSTAPSGPGKSGHAPGHTKHPRHGRRHR